MPHKGLWKIETHCHYQASVLTGSPNCARLWTEQSPIMVLRLIYICFMIWAIFPQTLWTSVSVTGKWTKNITSLTGLPWGLKWKMLYPSGHFILISSCPPGDCILQWQNHLYFTYSSQIYLRSEHEDHTDPLQWLPVTAGSFFCNIYQPKTQFFQMWWPYLDYTLCIYKSNTWPRYVP